MVADLEYAKKLIRENREDELDRNSAEAIYWNDVAKMHPGAHSQELVNHGKKLLIVDRKTHKMAETTGLSQVRAQEQQHGRQRNVALEAQLSRARNAFYLHGLNCCHDLTKKLWNGDTDNNVVSMLRNAAKKRVTFSDQWDPVYFLNGARLGNVYNSDHINAISADRQMLLGKNAEAIESLVATEKPWNARVVVVAVGDADGDQKSNTMRVIRIFGMYEDVKNSNYATVDMNEDEQRFINWWSGKSISLPDLIRVVIFLTFVWGLNSRDVSIMTKCMESVRGIRFGLPVLQILRLMQDYDITTAKKFATYFATNIRYLQAIHEQNFNILTPMNDDDRNAAFAALR